MYLTVVVISTIVLFLITKLVQRFSRFEQCLRKIPQVPGYPIFGNLFDVMTTTDKMFLDDRLRGLKYYPIYVLNVLGLKSVNILNPEDLEVVLTDNQQNSKGILYNLVQDWLGTGLLTSDGTKWQHRRKILTPAFHFSILQEFIKIFVKETEKLVKELESSDSVVDVVVPITHFALLSIGETSMGINLDSTNAVDYKKAIYEIGNLTIYRSTRPWLYNNFVYYNLNAFGRLQKKVLKVLHSFSNNLMAERKQASFAESSYSSRKKLAMLDLLLKYQREGTKIDDEGIREEVDTFMFEGHDTTSMSICFTLMLLANHPNHQEVLYKEMLDVLNGTTPDYSNLQDLKCMERFIKESLRLYPSVPFISRTSGTEIKTKTGYTIPKNCMVNIEIFNLHHNPNVFPDPEKFDPDRFLAENSSKRHPFAYLPFSAGARNCIGQKYAMLEIKTVLCGILKIFILEPIDTPDDMQFISDFVLRPKGKVRVKFVPRKE